MSAQGGTGHIIQSLVSNAVIAIAKGVAAVISGSGAMLAETLHSFADCGNQLLLLLGVRRSRKPPDDKHPLGRGREVYFWSFMVAMLLFSGGGVFSMYEGVHKLRHPEAVEDITISVIVLGISLLLEGWATISNVREINKRRGTKGFRKYLRDSKDSDLIVVFGENSAAVVGLVFALAAIILAHQTGDGRWDAAGSLAIGGVLIYVAIFLAVEVKSLLVGESADSEVEAVVRQLALEDPNLHELLKLITIQQGPGELILAIKVRLRSGLESSREVAQAINSFEDRIRARFPEAKWTFVEPDIASD
jgi:cation diffusion facilitator family transporter